MKITTKSDEDTPNPDKQRSRNGIAPNFVHSMDASHLQLTVNAAYEHGIHHFAMIHDSFGCHASDASDLAAILRDTFVKMYQYYDLADFRDDIVSQLEESGVPELVHELPELPEKGDLDLDVIRDSLYFFA